MAYVVENAMKQSNAKEDSVNIEFFFSLYLWCVSLTFDQDKMDIFAFFSWLLIYCKRKFRKLYT